MDPLLAQGLELTLVGMIVVFTFLVVLVGVVKALGFAVATLGLDAAPAPAATPAGSPALISPPAALDTRTLAVIQAAIRQHRGQA